MVSLTSVMSLEAAAALIWRLGWRMELLQSSALAKVPTALKQTQPVFNPDHTNSLPLYGKCAGGRLVHFFMNRQQVYKDTEVIR